MTYFDLMSPRPKKDGSTRWVKVGAAFPRDKGGFSLVFDALPPPDNEGRVSLMMWEAKPRDDRAPSGMSGAHRAAYDAQAPQGGSGKADFDDEIPFAPEWRI